MSMRANQPTPASQQESAEPLPSLAVTDEDVRESASALASGLMDTVLYPEFFTPEFLCRERQLRYALTKLRAAEQQRDEAIAAVRELEPAWEVQWKRATAAEAENARLTLALAQMGEQCDSLRDANAALFTQLEAAHVAVEGNVK